MAIYFTQNSNNIEDIEQMNKIVDKVNKVNTEATSKIERLEGLNTKAEELSNNINKGLPLNSELVKNTESAKIANTNLLATNQEAVSKNTELQASLEKTKEFINGLDGSQNIPQLRLDVDALQNGLKSNQTLAYKGSSISANNTLEGRTEGMMIKGRTLQNLYKANNIRDDVDGYLLVDTLPEDEIKNMVVYIVNNTDKAIVLNIYKTSGEWDSNPIIDKKSIFKLDLNGKKITGFLGMYNKGWMNNDVDKEILKNTCIVLDREETYIPQKYFEGIRSFGESEGNKISILSNTTNFVESFENTTTLEAGQYSEYKLINVKLQGELYQGLFKDGEFVSTSGSTVVYFYDESKNQIEWLTLNGKPRLFDWKNILVKAKYYRIYDNSNRIVFDDFFIGKEPTYSKSKLDKKDILIKEPLKSVGDIKDIIYEYNGQVRIDRRLGQYVFTGEEEICTEETIAENNMKFVITTKGTNVKSSGYVISDNFIKGNDTVSNSVRLATNNKVIINIDKTKLSEHSVEGFKEWLKTNPTTIVYQLAEPTVEIVENCVDIDLDTYQEKTYFSIENSLPGTLDFKVPSNIGSVVQNMAKEVNNIWDVINNLLVPGLIDVNKTVAMTTIKNNLK